MDQPSSPATPSVQTPPSVSNQKPAELPHLVVEEPKRGVFGILGILALSLMLLGIPLGIFLVSQRTQVAPQAAVEEKLPELDSEIVLESKLGSTSGEVPVDVYVKAPVDAVNLVEAKIKFDANSMSIDKIATSAAQVNQPALFNKWVDASFDNDKGVISIIAGLPTPGLKTGGSNDEKVYLATLLIRSKKAGSGTLQIDPSSQIFRNFDSTNIFKKGNALVLNLSASSEEASSSATPAAGDSIIVITDPKPGMNYSYFQPLNIAWSSFDVEKISQINLLVNDELLGPITGNLEARDGHFEWQIKETLALPYIQQANTFKVEVVGVSKKGQEARAVSSPFGILGTEEVAEGAPSEALGLKIADYSKALSNYLVLPLTGKGLDLNKDGVINDLDLFLIRQSFLAQGLVK